MIAASARLCDPPGAALSILPLIRSVSLLSIYVCCELHTMMGVGYIDPGASKQHRLDSRRNLAPQVRKSAVPFTPRHIRGASCGCALALQEATNIPAMSVCTQAIREVGRQQPVRRLDRCVQ